MQPTDKQTVSYSLDARVVSWIETNYRKYRNTKSAFVNDLLSEIQLNTATGLINFTRTKGRKRHAKKETN